MVNQQSSFIPKSPITPSSQKRTVRKIYVLTYVVYVLFVTTLLGAGGVWFYQQMLQTELNELTSQLAAEQANFSQSDLEEVSELDAQLTEASALVSRQVSLSNLFAALEEVTVSSVVMSGFSYQKGQTGSLEVLLSANADDFNTAIFQRSVLSSNPVLSGATLSEVVYNAGIEDESGATETISFKISKDLTAKDLPVVFTDIDEDTIANDGTESLSASTTVSTNE